MGWRIIKYIPHLFYLKHRRGHRIHSPYIYEFVSQVLFNALKSRVPANILQIHQELRKARSTLAERSIRSFVRRSSVSRKYGALLFRIARWQEPEIILELGTGLGISTMYLSAGSGSVPLHTIEGDQQRAAFSQRLFKLSGFDGVKVHYGDVDQELEKLEGKISGRFLAFVDANHKYDPTLRYLGKLIRGRGEESLIVMDDIYWSKDMNKAWREVIRWPEVRVSIDLFHMGILLLRKDLRKTHFKIKF